MLICSVKALSRARFTSRSMATIRSSMPHIDRTSAEPRENRIEPVLLSHISQVNDNIRLLRLNALDPNHSIHFLPGQWLDTFIPGLPQAGGFTITSTPSQARPSKHFPPYLELAVQKSKNPPAQWLWRPSEEILGSQLVVRVGGSFTWPPMNVDVSEVQRLVFVAGGVGINPLISIFSELIRGAKSARPKEIHFLYASKADSELDPQQILFLPRLLDLVAAEDDLANVTLSLFLTGTGENGVIEHGRLPNRTFARRIMEQDLINALDGYRDGPFDATHRKRTLCYVCGPPRMTDDFVSMLRKQEGMAEDRVLCEKWW